VLQIYTATNAKARELLNDTLVSEIAMKWRILFGPDKYSNADGLLRIINDYRLAITFLLLLVLCHFSGYMKLLCIYIYYIYYTCLNFCLQCFDTVGWVAGRASGL